MSSNTTGHRPRISLIVAMAENGVIGRANQLPWRLSNDLQFFKQVTMGKPVIMGRLTFESIGRPLPGRLNIVITRDRNWSADGVQVAHSLTAAIAIATRDSKATEKKATENKATENKATENNEIMVIGGRQIYLQALDLTDRIYMTRVHAQVEGDVTFPRLDPDEWRTTVIACHDKDERNVYSHDMIMLDRMVPAPA